MRLLLCTVCTAAAFAAAAAIAAPKPESAIRYRQSVFTMIGWNFGPIAQMVRGKEPWDAAAFAQHAERIAALAPQLPEGFPQGSDSGAKTEAKPAIWSDAATFKTTMDDFITQSAALAAVAKSGDEAKMKEQFKKTAGVCKTCHEKFRAE